jgi:hypothetical protein
VSSNLTLSALIKPLPLMTSYQKFLQEQEEERIRQIRNSVPPDIGRLIWFTLKWTLILLVAYNNVQ